jgi:hypothetical protein
MSKHSQTQLSRSVQRAELKVTEERSNQVDEMPKQSSTSITMKKGSIYYLAGCNVVLEGAIRQILSFLLDYRLGLMCLGIALGSMFANWLNSLFPPRRTGTEKNFQILGNNEDWLRVGS